MRMRNYNWSRVENPIISNNKADDLTVISMNNAKYFIKNDKVYYMFVNNSVLLASVESYQFTDFDITDYLDFKIVGEIQYVKFNELQVAFHRDLSGVDLSRN